MKKLLWMASLLVFTLLVTGCEKILDTPEPIVDSTLPSVNSLRTLPDIKAIGFEWSPAYDERIKGYYLYRIDANGKMKRVATIPDRYSSHYVDTPLTPATEYSYRISAYAADKRESVLSPVVTVSTTGAIDPISYVNAVSNLPKRVKIIWKPHTAERVDSYIIERNEFKSSSWEEIATVKGRLNAEYIDKDLKDNYVYRYRVKAKTFDGVESKPSDVVEAHTKPLPSGVSGVQATSDLPKKIIVKWNATNQPQEDFTHYKIYRSPTSALFYTYYAKTVDTEFEDLINDNGKTYYYKVVVVDKDGLESPQERAVSGMTLAALAAPVVNSVRKENGVVSFAWSGDRNTVKYTITKDFDGKQQKFTGLFDTSFQDTDVIPGVEYKYHIISIDKYGIASKPSDSIVVTLPKGQ